MSKKDRIAITVSALYSLLVLGGLSKDPALGLILAFPLILYWGYRFIKGNISFLDSSGREE
jgi:hypothetical protein